MNLQNEFFIEIFAPDGTSRKIKITNEKTILGRHESCTIRLGVDDQRVSNRHAAIFIKENGATIEDLGSTNHLFINEVQVTKSELKHNDIVRFGKNGPRFRCIIQNSSSDSDISTVSLDQQSVQNKKPEIEGSSSKNISVMPDDSSLFDVSPDSEYQEISPVSDGSTLPKTKDTALVKDAPSETDSVDSEIDNSIFSINPDKENYIDPLPFSGSKIKKDIESVSRVKKGKPPLQAVIEEDNQLFDISPDSDNVSTGRSLNVSNTMEISSRLQKQMLCTEDIDTLVKNAKTRNKILNDENIGEQQRQLITSVTKAYFSMKRKYFIVFGAIIGCLFIVSIWFASGYFSYKHQLAKARTLKDQIKSFDDQFEKARLQDDAGGSKMETLYKKLQLVQQQYDSIKAKLEFKDQKKIYSDTVEVFLDEVMGELNEKNYSIPHHMLERVKFYINQFSTDKHRSTEVLLNRRKIYFDEIVHVFTKKNVPSILAYVAMQESLLDTIIKSPVGAAGMWQFMKNTAIRYNLIVNETVDERLDWKKSTMAAADYFRSLLLQFGDGRGALLAIAAYNAGEEKIKRALENVVDPIRDRDFWYLYRTSTILADETREYVPQVLARIIIDRHATYYGFKSGNADTN